MNRRYLNLLRNPTTAIKVLGGIFNNYMAKNQINIDIAVDNKIYT
jgi:hypothetical protein